MEVQMYTCTQTQKFYMQSELQQEKRNNGPCREETKIQQKRNEGLLLFLCNIYLEQYYKQINKN